MDSLSEVPESEGGVLACSDHESVRGVSGAVGELIIVTRQLLDTLTSAGVPDRGQSVPASSDDLVTS